MIFVVFAILVVNGVQHAVCVTFSTSVFKIESVIRERRRTREREREKEKEREREEEEKDEHEEEEEEGEGEEERKEEGEGEKERAREKGRERGREKERERERTGCFCKRRFFLLLASGSALEKFAAIVNPGKKPSGTVCCNVNSGNKPAKAN